VIIVIIVIMVMIIIVIIVIIVMLVIIIVISILIIMGGIFPGVWQATWCGVYRGRSHRLALCPARVPRCPNIPYAYTYIY